MCQGDTKKQAGTNAGGVCHIGPIGIGIFNSDEVSINTTVHVAITATTFTSIIVQEVQLNSENDHEQEYEIENQWERLSMRRASSLKFVSLIVLFYIDNGY